MFKGHNFLEHEMLLLVLFKSLSLAISMLLLLLDFAFTHVTVPFPKQERTLRKHKPNAPSMSRQKIKETLDVKSLRVRLLEYYLKLAKGGH